MADLIDRKKAIDEILRLTSYGTVLSLYEATVADKYDDYKAGIMDAIDAVIGVDVAEIVKCAECHFFERDHFEKVEGVPVIVAHNICTRWGRGCMTAEDGYCFMGIREGGKRCD